jgi:cobalamin-dependent methionine synthase I
MRLLGACCCLLALGLATQAADHSAEKALKEVEPSGALQKDVATNLRKIRAIASKEGRNKKDKRTSQKKKKNKKKANKKKKNALKERREKKKGRQNKAKGKEQAKKKKEGKKISSKNQLFK